MSAEQFVEVAKKWAGKEFHPGVPAQCAAFVSAMLDEAGFVWPHAVNKNWAPDLSGADNGKPIGKRVAFDEMRPGDLVFFGDTYVPGTSTHVGIHIKDGIMVHRPTRARPVENADITSGYWRDHFEVAVRPSWPVVASKWTKLFLNAGKARAFEHGTEKAQMGIRVQLSPGGMLHVFRNGEEIKPRSVSIEIEEE